MDIRAERGWMYNRLLPGRKGLTNEFLQGVEYFIYVACQLPVFLTEGKFRCPCSKHKNMAYLTPDDVKLDLYRRGFLPGYWYWTSHGEFEPHSDCQCGPSETSRPVDQQWVDQRSKKAHDDFIRIRETQPLSGERSSLRSTQYSEYQTWLKVVGGKKKGRVYGLGSAAKVYEQYHSSSASYGDRGVDEILSQRVAALSKELEKMRQIQATMMSQQIQIHAEMRSFMKENRKKGKEPEPESEDSKETHEAE